MYAANVVYAKVHALYGRRLSEADYNQLLQKKSVGEVAGYLKQNTAYAGVLREIREELIHRGQLENLVHRHRADICGRLLKYTLGRDFFYGLYAMQNEIRQLLAAMRMLRSGSMDRYVVDFPPYLNQYLSIDLFALAGIRSFDDLLEVVRHSDYYALLGAFRPVGGAGELDLPGCEAALLTHYYKTALAAAGTLRGGARSDLEQILRLQADLHNIRVIYRLKRFFHFSPDETRACLVPVKGNLPQAFMDRLVNAGNAEQVLALLAQARRTRRFFHADTQDPEQASHRLQRDVSLRAFRFSSDPIVVLLAYMALLEIEVDNIIGIIEGIRYALPPEQIRELLIL